jgi:hypothetical protein
MGGALPNYNRIEPNGAAQFGQIVSFLDPAIAARIAAVMLNLPATFRVLSPLALRESHD